MKFINDMYVSFSYDEEISIAKKVYDCILIKNIDDEFFQFLIDMFEKKASIGYMITVEDLDFLLKNLDIYKIKYPIIEEDGSTLDHQLYIEYSTKKFYDKNRMIYETRLLRIQAWKESWETHKIKTNYDFPVLELKNPFDINDHENNKKLKDLFEKEVLKVMEDYNISVDEAIQLVSDYIPLESSENENYC